MKGHRFIALFALLVLTLLALPANGAWLMIVEDEEPALVECPVQMRLVSLADFDYDDDNLFACVPDDISDDDSADAGYDPSPSDDDKHEGPHDGMPLDVPQFN